MKRPLTAAETLLLVDALGAYMQDLRALVHMHSRVENKEQEKKHEKRLEEACTMRNVLLQTKDYQLHIEGP